MINPHSEEARRATVMTNPTAKSLRDPADLHAHMTISVYDVPRRPEDTQVVRPLYLCMTIVYHPELTRVGEYFAWRYEVGSEQVLARQQPIFQTPTPLPSRALDLPYISRSPTRILCLDDEVQLLPDSHRVQLHLDGRAAGERETLSFAQLRRGVLLVLRQQVAVILHGLDEHPALQREPLLGQSHVGYQLQNQAHRLRKLKMPILITGGSSLEREAIARELVMAHLDGDTDAQPSSTAPARVEGFQNLASTELVVADAVALSAGLALEEQRQQSRPLLSEVGSGMRTLLQQSQGRYIFLDHLDDASPGFLRELSRLISEQGVPLAPETGRQMDIRLLVGSSLSHDELRKSPHLPRQLLEALTMVTLEIPALSERLVDIPLLFLHFLRSALQELAATARLQPPPGDQLPWLSLRTLLTLLRYDWPGNGRELRNVAYQMATRHHARPFAQLPDWLLLRVDTLDLGLPSPVNPVQSTRELSANSTLTQETFPRAEPTSPPRPGLSFPLIRPSQLDGDTLVQVLEECGWNIVSAARRLGIARNSLYLLMERHGLRNAGDLTEAELKRVLEEYPQAPPEELAAHLKVSERGLKLRLRKFGLER